MLEYNPAQVTASQEFNPAQVTVSQEQDFNPVLVFNPEQVTVSQEFNPAQVTVSQEFNPEQVTVSQEQELNKVVAFNQARVMVSQEREFNLVVAFNQAQVTVSQEQEFNQAQVTVNQEQEFNPALVFNQVLAMFHWDLALVAGQAQDMCSMLVELINKEDYLKKEAFNLVPVINLALEHNSYPLVFKMDKAINLVTFSLAQVHTQALQLADSRAIYRVRELVNQVGDQPFLKLVPVMVSLVLVLAIGLLPLLVNNRVELNYLVEVYNQVEEQAYNKVLDMEQDMMPLTVNHQVVAFRALVMVKPELDHNMDRVVCGP